MPAESATYAFGPFVLDRSRRLLLREGAAVGLTPKAFDLLALLVEHDGTVVTKETLMNRLWPDTAVEESNLTFQISTLRKVLGEGRYVVTVPGRGYQFAGGVERIYEPLVQTETIVEDERRMTVTVSEHSRITPWIAAVAIVAIVVITALMLLRRTPRATPGIRSIAVLPFRPIVAAQRDESLELGMADTLITRLSHIPGLVVSPTSAVRRYSALDQDPLAAGRDLGTDAVLDGSIQRSGDRVRVTVRLLRTSDGGPLWASQFDQSARDLFDVQDGVADGIARAIAPSLSGRAQEDLTRRMTDDLAAYDLYVKGVYWKVRDGKRALEFFNRSLERDPRLAESWTGIAETWLQRGRFTDGSNRKPFENARAAAEKALALDPDLADAHAALASVYGDSEWRWADAEREYRRALELNPNEANIHNAYSVHAVFRRDFVTALEHSQRAIELDPLSLSIGVARGMVLRFSGRNDEAARHMKEVVRANPEINAAKLHLAMALTNAGHPEEGMKVLQEAMKHPSSNSQLPALYAYASAKAGHRDEALRVVGELEEVAKRAKITAPNLALAYTALGDRDRAFAWLERAFEDRQYLLRMITVEQGFAPLREDPRYVDLIRRMGL